MTGCCVLFRSQHRQYQLHFLTGDSSSEKWSHHFLWRYVYKKFLIKKFWLNNQPFSILDTTSFKKNCSRRDTCFDCFGVDLSRFCWTRIKTFNHDKSLFALNNV